MSRFIIEGIDRSGKSTLVKHFLHADFKVIHCPYRTHKSGIFEFYTNLLRINRDKVVFDRFFISEAVYGPTLRGSSRIAKTAFISLCEDYFHEKDSAVIYLVEEIETIRRRLASESNGEHSLVLRNLSTLLRAYDGAMTLVSSIGKVFKLRPSEMTAREIHEFVAARAK